MSLQKFDWIWNIIAGGSSGGAGSGVRHSLCFGTLEASGRLYIYVSRYTAPTTLSPSTCRATVYGFEAISKDLTAAILQIVNINIQK